MTVIENSLVVGQLVKMSAALTLWWLVVPPAGMSLCILGIPRYMYMYEYM